MEKLVALRNMSFAPVALALVLASSAFGLWGCTAEEGTTPTCDQNVGADGFEESEKGCNQFAVCRDEAGKTREPEFCCVIDGTPMEGAVLQICLYGYGKGVPSPTSGSGGGGGSGAGGGDTGGAGGGG